MGELADRLRELQELPLERKIMITQTRIIDWYQHFNGQVYISFSGGKDSTVLLDIAREIYPEIEAVFVNTGLEYPEIRSFALAHKNVTELYPVWGRAAKKHGKKPSDPITFMDTIQFYGYPLISKAVSNAIVGARSNQNGSRWVRLHGEYTRRDGKRSCYDYSKYLPIYFLPIKISDECCKVNKKGPAHIYQRKTGKQPIVATMAEESLIRKQAWITSGGCNAFNAALPISKPMSFWTEQNVLHYIRSNHRQICSVYGDIVAVGEDGCFYDIPDCFVIPGLTPLACTGCQRTGCMYCSFGLHLEDGETRFQRMKRTHPRQYEFCIGGGEWQKNDRYDSTMQDKNLWNPKEIWGPTKKGLGMGKVFDMLNEIYGKDFIRYE